MTQYVLSSMAVGSAI